MASRRPQPSASSPPSVPPVQAHPPPPPPHPPAFVYPFPTATAPPPLRYKPPDIPPQPFVPQLTYMEGQFAAHALLIEQQRRIKALEAELASTQMELMRLRATHNQISDSPHPSPPPPQPPHHPSDDAKKTSSRYWTAHEHNRFLEGLRLFGQKDIKAIARHVGTRNATQVRTHAQKYYLRIERERAKAANEHKVSNKSTSNFKSPTISSKPPSSADQPLVNSASNNPSETHSTSLNNSASSNPTHHNNPSANTPPSTAPGHTHLSPTPLAPPPSLETTPTVDNLHFASSSSPLHTASAVSPAHQSSNLKLEPNLSPEKASNAVTATAAAQQSALTTTKPPKRPTSTPLRHAPRKRGKPSTAKPLPTLHTSPTTPLSTHSLPRNHALVVKSENTLAVSSATLQSEQHRQPQPLPPASSSSSSSPTQLPSPSPPPPPPPPPPQQQQEQHNQQPQQQQPQQHQSERPQQQQQTQQQQLEPPQQQQQQQPQQQQQQQPQPQRPASDQKPPALNETGGSMSNLRTWIRAVAASDEPGPSASKPPPLRRNGSSNSVLAELSKSAGMLSRSNSFVHQTGKGVTRSNSILSLLSGIPTVMRESPSTDRLLGLDTTDDKVLTALKDMAAAGNAAVVTGQTMTANNPMAMMGDRTFSFSQLNHMGFDDLDDAGTVALALQDDQKWGEP